MYHTVKPVERLDFTVYLPYPDAFKSINRYSVGRQLYFCAEIPLPVLNREAESYLPGYAHIPVTRSQAKNVVESLMKGFADRPEPGTIKVHVYHGCVFIGGHYSPPTPTPQ